MFTQKLKKALPKILTKRTGEQSQFKSYFKITPLPKTLKLKRMRLKQTIESSQLISTLLRLIAIGIGYSIMIAYTPGCHMPLQAQIKMRIIERVHKKNKKKMEAYPSDSEVMSAMSANMEIIDYLARHLMLDYLDFGLLAQQIDVVTILLDQTDADLSDKILTQSLRYIQKVLDSLSSIKGDSQDNPNLDYFQSNQLFQAFVNYLDMFLIKKKSIQEAHPDQSDAEYYSSGLDKRTEEINRIRLETPPQLFIFTLIQAHKFKQKDTSALLLSRVIEWLSMETKGPHSSLKKRLLESVGLNVLFSFFPWRQVQTTSKVVAILSLLSQSKEGAQTLYKIKTVSNLLRNVYPNIKETQENTDKLIENFSHFKIELESMPEERKRLAQILKQEKALTHQTKKHLKRLLN